MPRPHNVLNAIGVEHHYRIDAYSIPISYQFFLHSARNNKKYARGGCETRLVTGIPPPGGPIEKRNGSFVHHGFLKLSYRFH